MDTVIELTTLGLHPTNYGPFNFTIMANGGGDGEQWIHRPPILEEWERNSVKLHPPAT